MSVLNALAVLGVVFLELFIWINLQQEMTYPTPNGRPQVQEPRENYILGEI